MENYKECLQWPMEEGWNRPKNKPIDPEQGEACVKVPLLIKTPQKAPSKA